MFRSRFSDAERIEMVTMELRGEPVSKLTEKFGCSEHSIYQARRSAWYQLLAMALVPHIGDKRDSSKLMPGVNTSITTDPQLPAV